jgi:hypothetical protein
MIWKISNLENEKKIIMLRYLCVFSVISAVKYFTNIKLFKL